MLLFHYSCCFFNKLYLKHVFLTCLVFQHVSFVDSTNMDGFQGPVWHAGFWTCHICNMVYSSWHAVSLWHPPTDWDIPIMTCMSWVGYLGPWSGLTSHAFFQNTHDNMRILKKGMWCVALSEKKLVQLNNLPSKSCLYHLAYHICVCNKTVTLAGIGNACTLIKLQFWKKCYHIQSVFNYTV